ncbi:hypothetical protein ACJJU9_04360 [Pseudomonas helleri]|uniref:hypothetical protein n=1 Tax=Pseudomonas helleri TaxID=1608996 RepID=UPI00389A6FA6
MGELKAYRQEYSFCTGRSDGYLAFSVVLKWVADLKDFVMLIVMLEGENHNVAPAPNAWGR